MGLSVQIVVEDASLEASPSTGWREIVAVMYAEEGARHA